MDDKHILMHLEYLWETLKSVVGGVVGVGSSVESVAWVVCKHISRPNKMLRSSRKLTGVGQVDKVAMMSLKSNGRLLYIMALKLASEIG